MPDCTTNVLCQITKIKSDILSLFGRTDDINFALDAFATTINSFRVIRTEQELINGIAIGGVLLIAELIQITQTVELTVPHTHLIAFSLDGSPVGLLFPHTVGVQKVIIDIRADHCSVIGLDLSTNHPKNTDNTTLDIAINMYGAVPPWDTSNFIIEGNDIHDIGIGIALQSGTTAAVVHRGRITNNHIHAFCGTGIYLAWNLDSCLVENNFISGRDAGQTHVTDGVNTHGNAIFAGLKITNIVISRNTCINVDRHAIELIGGSADGNHGNRITDNICEDCWFGISAWGSRSIIISGNQIERCKDIGIELIGFATDQAEYIIKGNSIRDVRYTAATTISSVGIVVNGTVNSLLIEGNQIGKITSRPALTIEAFGIELYANAGDGGGSDVCDVNIRGNVFTDSGTRMIYANPGGGGVYTRYVIENNTFFSSPLYDGFYGTGANWYAILINSVTLAVIRNNISYYHSVPAKAFGRYALLGTSSIYTSDAATPPETVVGAFTGTNLRIAYP